MKKILIAVIVVVAGSLLLLHQNHPMLLMGLVAIGLGLRHGLDVDHVIAIDNITRKFQSESKNSYLTGLFFALGHSSVVFILTFLLIVTLGKMSSHLDTLVKYGSVIGSLISAFFLWLTAGVNLHAFYVIKSDALKSHPHKIGRFPRFFDKVFTCIDEPFKIYFVGFLFGLGFDTATEVGLLGISASSVLQGMKIGFILLLPVLFACGMVVTDLLDSIFMSSLYELTISTKNGYFFYYKLIIIFTTLLAITVGLFEVVSLFKIHAVNSFLIKITDLINNHSEFLGESIVCIFLALFGYLKIFKKLYKTA